MDIQDVITGLGEGIFPNIIQFVWVLLALAGVVVIGFGLKNMYEIASEGGPQPGGPTQTGSMVQLLIGGLRVVPSVTLWHAANLFLDGGDSTAGDLLTYVSGGGALTGCDNFARAIQLGFMAFGAIAIYRGFLLWNDGATGFHREGYRTGTMFLIGGIGCFFIDDLIDVVGNEFGFDVGFDAICTALGA